MHKSIILDHCWACKRRDGLHDHHIVPQAYGGVDGPQVTLCGSHHTLIHEVALKPKQEWAQRIPVEHHATLGQLVSIIANARASTKHLEKPMTINHKLSMDRSRRLRELKLLLGQKSITAALDMAIDIVYDQLHPAKQ